MWVRERERPRGRCVGVGVGRGDRRLALRWRPLSVCMALFRRPLPTSRGCPAGTWACLLSVLLLLQRLALTPRSLLASSPSLSRSHPLPLPPPGRLLQRHQPAVHHHRRVLHRGDLPDDVRGTKVRVPVGRRRQGACSKRPLAAFLFRIFLALGRTRSFGPTPSLPPARFSSR